MAFNLIAMAPQPNCRKYQWPPTSIAMASNLIAVAFNLVAMASNLLIAIAANLNISGLQPQ